MSDADSRRVVRTQEDEVAWLCLRVRSGEVEERRLQLGAALGHPSAGRALTELGLEPLEEDRIAAALRALPPSLRAELVEDCVRSMHAVAGLPDDVASFLHGPFWQDPADVETALASIATFKEFYVAQWRFDVAIGLRFLELLLDDNEDAPIPTTTPWRESLFASWATLLLSAE